MADKDQSSALRFSRRPAAGEEPVSSWIHKEVLPKLRRNMLANIATPMESKERILVRNWTAQENCSRTNLFVLDIISVPSLQKPENQLLSVMEAKQTWRKKSIVFLNIPCEIFFWMPYDYVQAINVHNSRRCAAAYIYIYIYCTCLKTISQQKILTRTGLQCQRKITLQH